MYNKLKFLVLLVCLSSDSVLAQSIQVLMSPKPSPYISDWQQQTETVKLVISNSSSKEIEVKIKTELYDGKGGLIGNTDDSKMPVLVIPPTSTTTYDPEDIFPSRAIKYYGNIEKTAITTGRIPDDNYRICVALIDPQSGRPIGTSGTVCKVFTIVAYQAPTLINPTNKEIIKGAAIKGIVFRWSPVIPSPKTIVTYRLQVWEVLEGQNSMTALRSNQPIVEKDLKGMLQAQWPIDFPLPDTGKPYVWTITPLDDDGRKMVDGPGFSEPFEFRACCFPPPISLPPEDPDIILISPGDGQEISKDITFSWTNNAAKPKDVYTLRIVELKGDQSPDVAIANNPVAFEQKGIVGTSFKLGDSVGKLKRGKKYVWAVKGGDGFAEPFLFSITADGGKTRPFAVRPLMGSKINIDSSKSIDFEWTSVQSAASYKLKIYELEPGEDAKQLVGWPGKRIPITDADINAVTYSWPVPDVNAKEEKRFAWTVQALDKDGKGVGENNGISEVNSMIVKSKGVESQTPVRIYTNLSNERGIKGVGFNPGPNHTTPEPTAENQCKLPNGICYYAEIAPHFDTRSKGMNGEVHLLGNNKIRFAFLKESLFDKSLIKKELEGKMEKDYIEKYINHIQNHFEISNNLTFSKEDSRKIFSIIGGTGTNIVMLKGDYIIKTSDKYKYGYFDVNIKIDPESGTDKFQVKKKGNDWYFSAKIDDIKKQIQIGVDGQQSIALSAGNTHFSCEYDFNNCLSRIGYVNGSFILPGYSPQDYSRCIEARYDCIQRHQFDHVEKLPDDWVMLSDINKIVKNNGIINVRIPVELMRNLKDKVKDITVSFHPYIEGILFEFNVSSLNSKETIPIYLFSRRDETTYLNTRPDVVLQTDRVLERNCSLNYIAFESLENEDIYQGTYQYKDYILKAYNNMPVNSINAPFFMNFEFDDEGYAADDLILSTVLTPYANTALISYTLGGFRSVGTQGPLFYFGMINYENIATIRFRYSENLPIPAIPKFKISFYTKQHQFICRTDYFNIN